MFTNLKHPQYLNTKETKYKTLYKITMNQLNTLLMLPYCLQHSIKTKLFFSDLRIVPEYKVHMYCFGEGDIRYK